MNRLPGSAGFSLLLHGVACAGLVAWASLREPHQAAHLEGAMEMVWQPSAGPADGAESGAAQPESAPESAPKSVMETTMESAPDVAPVPPGFARPCAD